MQVVSTNLKNDLGNTECSLSCVQPNMSVSRRFHVDLGELTAAKIPPYLITTLSTDFPIDSLISGEYSCSNSSSSWSDDRRASAYANIIGWQGCAVAKVRTVAFAENRSSRVTLCLPMGTASVLLNQKCMDSLVKELTQQGEIVVVRSPVIIE